MAHSIYYYRNRRGEAPVKDYIDTLGKRTDKQSRVQLNKIQDYIQLLSKNGTRIGEPYVKHLGGELWELRPRRDRIIFVACVDGGYVLLHHFMKKTQKTPHSEIEQAERELKDLLERGLQE